MLTYNMLRIIGQISLEESDKHNWPGFRNKKNVTRRRIRAIIQDLKYMAVKLLSSGRRWFITFGSLNPFAKLYKGILNRIREAPVKS